MNDFFDYESIVNYEKSEIIQEIYYSLLDFAIIIISIFKIKTINRHMVNLKNIIIEIFILDIIIRLLFARKYSNWNIYKEIMTTFINTIQFYLILSFLDKILYYPGLSKAIKSNDNSKIIKFCDGFFLITFQYEKFLKLNLNKIIISIRSLFILFCIYKLYKYLNDIITKIVSNLISGCKIQINNKINLVILGSPLLCSILFSVYYILKIVIAFIYKPLFALYLNILLSIIKNSSTYFVFFICGAIIYVLNKINEENEKEKQNKDNIEESIKINS